jgi:transcriptional regulator with AAA-type ATPase domain
MSFNNETERRFARCISRLVYTNPFLSERIEGERAALGEAFIPGDRVWNALADPERKLSNVERIGSRADALALSVRERLADGAKATAEEIDLYEQLVFYVLYHRSREKLAELADVSPNPETLAPADQRSNRKAPFNADFARDAGHFLGLNLPGRSLAKPDIAPHLFACFFQIRRAFHNIFAHIVGRSMPAARLRGEVWQSIFTHDVRRYFRALYDRMGDFTTLVTGESGTGKELVARAIGHSRYVPFDARTKSFSDDYAASFHALNLSALSPTLIESELFGHRRGAFTGALEDRAGWLEACPAMGTVFLDEIGELDPVIQVKLLRVLQTRTFQRLGDTHPRNFKGKIIAATNRDLAREMSAGRFRKDFYYRLCSDMIRTPSLREQLQDSPEELHSLVLFVARKLAGSEAEGLADEVMRWVKKHLGVDYAWAGNFRELEQCVRNVLIRHEYHPPAAVPVGAGAELAESMELGSLTAEQLIQKYCKLIYAKTRNYEETARRLGLDRRTVKSKVTAAENGEELAADERG